MLKERKHIKKSKGERLDWIRVSNDKSAIVFKTTLDSRFLKPVRVSEKRVGSLSSNANYKLLVP